MFSIIIPTFNNLEYLKLALIGGVIVGTLQLAPKGLLPEIPGRPERSIVQGSNARKDL